MQKFPAQKLHVLTVSPVPIVIETLRVAGTYTFMQCSFVVFKCFSVVSVHDEVMSIEMIC